MGSADVTATYGVEVDVTGADTALDAADALEKLRDKIGEDTAALGAMQKALRGLQGGVAVDIQSFKQLRAAIAAKKVEIGQANQQLVKFKGAFDGLGPAAKRAKAATDAVAFKTLTKEVLGSEKAFLGLRLSTLKAVPPHIALAAAAVAITLAFAAASAAVFKFGVASADARRNEAIDIQAAGTRLWYGYGNAVMYAADETEAGAKAISGALDRVSNSTTVGRERVAGFARELEAAGLRGQDLETSLKAVSTAASVGKEAGLVGLFQSLRFAGQGVDNLAARVQQKLGPLVERKLLSLDSQFQRLRENFALLFKNVNVTPILKALDRVLSLFSQTKAVGYSLRIALEALFPTASATKFGEVAVQAFKQVVIAGLRVTLGVLGLEVGFFRLRKGLEGWWKSVKSTFSDVGAVLAPIKNFLDGLDRVVDQVNAKGDEIGKAMVDGVKAGLQVSSPELTRAVEGVARGTETTFKKELEIRSPSGKFRDAARQIPAGAVEGINDGAPAVQAAADRMAPSPRAGGGKGGATITVNIGEGAIQISGKNAGELMAALDDGLADALERAAQRLGAVLEVA